MNGLPIEGGKLNTPQTLHGGSLASPSAIGGGQIRQAGLSVKWYEGSYSITPSSEAQTLPTKFRVEDADIVIQPIPQNYGLITWNGSTITVS